MRATCMHLGNRQVLVIAAAFYFNESQWNRWDSEYIMICVM